METRIGSGTRRDRPHRSAKLAHHGLSGSNTPSCLASTLPTHAVQTGNSSNLPEYATKTLTGSASATSPRRKRRRTDTLPSWPRSREMACI